MQLKCGPYLFPVNATKLSASIDTEFNDGGLPKSQKKSLHVVGYLPVVGQLDATLAESALRTALAVQFQDILFLTDAGTPSALTLVNAGSITGVKITNLKFPETEGPEYATIRSFEFDAEAEYPLVNDGLLSFKETLSFEGGQPVFAFRLAIEGPNQKQLVWPQDTFKATQEGSAKGYRSPPDAPPPMWPFALMKAPKITRTSPERKGNNYEGYEVTWHYDFEDIGPLIGLPNMWK